jgi:hypothetical protein
VAEDAVLIKPVSAPKFPVIREINWEFCQFCPSGVILTSVQRVNSMASSQIPCQKELGIFSTKQGSLRAETRNFVQATTPSVTGQDSEDERVLPSGSKCLGFAPDVRESARFATCGQ